MANGREEAAPTFSAWRRRLQDADKTRTDEEIPRFLQILRTVGAPMIDGSEVNFIYFDENARQVMLVGEFNDWGRSGKAIALDRLNGTGLFFHTLVLAEPARLEYKLVVDGEWKTDPLCPNVVDNGVGGENSYFETGDFRDPPELLYASDIPHGRVEESEFASERLGNRRRIYVYTPPAYDDDSAARYRSFYVHDGGEYLERAKMTNVLDNLIHSGAIPPLLAIMIDPVDRMREYWSNKDYTEFLCADFIPEIDRRYRTINDRKCRAVMGASLGGLISAYAALSHPRMFSAVAGQSSALHLDEGKIAALLGDAKGVRMRFYLDVGKYEPRFIPAHQRFVAAVKKKRWPCLYQELAGGHNWTSWRAHLKDLLVFVWAEAQGNKRGRPLKASA